MPSYQILGLQNYLVFSVRDQYGVYFVTTHLCYLAHFFRVLLDS